MVKKLNRKGLLILQQIEFDDAKERIVIKNNESSGKITLPRNWIGKKVYAVLTEE